MAHFGNKKIYLDPTILVSILDHDNKAGPTFSQVVGRHALASFMTLAWKKIDCNNTSKDTPVKQLCIIWIINKLDQFCPIGNFQQLNAFF